MHGRSNALAGVVRRLGSQRGLDEADRAALLALPYALRTLPPGHSLVRDGDRPDHVWLLLAGFACRYKLTGDGARQILSVHVPGEFIDLHNAMLGEADHSAQTLGQAEAALIPCQALAELAAARPAIGRALWIETLADASVMREWVLNVGRRDSRARVAHLLCELSLRLEAAGLAAGRRFELPMTQEQLADAAGLTSVHVNRVLRQLGREGLISRDRRTLTIEDWDGLREAGDFNERYLHLPARPAG